MNSYRITIQIESAFGTPLVGDSLFGQFCWAIANHFGEARLTTLLQGYAEQQPFAVFSDAFPADHLPLPTLPSRFWQKGENEDRKALKKKQWLAISDLDKPLAEWQLLAKAEKNILAKTAKDQPHNTIRRDTQSTGTGIFAPYVSTQIWYAPQSKLDIYLVIDENRLTLAECEKLLTDMGKLGFGRDASIGLGKFSLTHIEAVNFPTHNANAFLTLANCAPQKLALEKSRCYYQITTRFGRHGDIKALSGNPFKKPVILAKAGAIFTPQTAERERQAVRFLGNGLVNISYAQNEAVHQGYAPVIPVQINFDDCKD